MKIISTSIEQLDKTRRNGKPRPKSECRKWRVWVNTDEGRKSKRCSGTYTDASNALTAFVDELTSKVSNPDSFGSYAELWRSYREKSGNLSPNMIAKDRRNVRALARTDIYNLRMDEVTPEDCRRALLWLKSNPVAGSGELSNSTIASIHVTLNGILSQAANDGKIARNPMEHVQYPKINRKERTALTPDGISQLLDALDKQPADAHIMAVYLIAMLGLRRAEALALYDSDIHDGYVFVSRAVKEASGTIDTPKSKSGVRTLPAPPRLLAKVDEWREIRAELGLSDAPTLCCNKYGGTMRPQNLYRWWAGRENSYGARDYLGFEGLDLHELRHSNLSMIARFMSAFDLQRYAGWSSIAPAKIYVHDDLSAVTAAVNACWRS